MNYARIDNGMIVELFTTDLDIAELFHPDLIWVDITSFEPKPREGWSASVSEGGWSFAEVVAPVPTYEELKVCAIYKRDYLISLANESTVGMADAFVAGLLSPEEVSRFKAFAAYKLELNKVVSQPGFPSSIDWPVSPT